MIPFVNTFRDCWSRTAVASVLKMILPLLAGTISGPADAADPEVARKAAPASLSTNAARPGAAASWSELFDGKTLTGWKVTDFAGHGGVQVKDGQIISESGRST